eukprot:g9581.t1
MFGKHCSTTAAPFSRVDQSISWSIHICWYHGLLRLLFWWLLVVRLGRACLPRAWRGAEAGQTFAQCQLQDEQALEVARLELLRLDA